MSVFQLSTVVSFTAARHGNRRGGDSFSNMKFRHPNRALKKDSSCLLSARLIVGFLLSATGGKPLGCLRCGAAVPAVVGGDFGSAGANIACWQYWIEGIETYWPPARLPARLAGRLDGKPYLFVLVVAGRAS